MTTKTAAVAVIPTPTLPSSKSALQPEGQAGPARGAGLSPLVNRFRIARDFLVRRERSSGLPVELSIELTSECNLKCVMCPRDDESARGLGYMKFDTFRRIIDQAAPGLEFAYLHMAGEPLLHPEFDRFIDYAAGRGITIGISTNGTVLTSHRARRLLASRLDTLIISIDGTDAETYRKVRGANSFDKVLRNTARFLDLKEQAGRGPYTVVQMVCMRENIAQAREFCRRWRRPGVNAVRLKRFFNFAGNVENRGPGTVAVAPPGSAGKKPCYLPWRQLAFYYDGTAVACCHDFLHQSELGNIHEHTMAEIWNGDVMRDIRYQHARGCQDQIGLCANCNQPQVSALQVLVSSLLDGRTAKRALITAERLARRIGLDSLY